MKARHLIALSVLAAACASGAGAQQLNVAVSCEATMSFSCAGAACESEVSETPLPIAVTYNPATQHGDLCTYTYCRSFELLTPPRAEGQGAIPHTGFTLSEHSGSTPQYQNQPVVDFQLSISEDFSRFVLTNVHQGGVGGWAGPCTLRAP